MTPIEASATIITAINRRDYQSLVVLLHDGYRYEDHAADLTFGRAEFVEQYLDAWTRGLPDIRLVKPRYHQADHDIWIEAEVVGTHGGPLAWHGAKIEATGRQIRLSIAIHHHFDPRGLLRTAEVWYCGRQLLSQLGALPAIGQGVRP